MKTKFIDTIIVVEGTTDKNYLSSFIDCGFYIVNGSAISQKDINFLKLAKANKNIIILTDPDFPGMQIRNKINEQIEGCFNAFVRKEFSIKRHKVGVAECDKEEVLKALNDIKIFKKTSENHIKLDDLFDLGLTGKDDSKVLRQAISEELGIGYCNTKQFLSRINSLNLNVEQLREVIKNVRY